jgi:hypothetical protein
MQYRIPAILAGMALCTASMAKADNWETCSSIGFCGARASLPVFGPGPMTNVDTNDRASMTNALTHIAVATAIPLAGGLLWGPKGKLAAGLGWIAFTLIQEAFFHAPENPGPAYPSEVRADLLTRIAPTILVLSF